MTTQKQVEEYIVGALRYPLKDTEQLVAMVCLHFSDLTMVAARTMVATGFVKAGVTKGDRT